MISAQEVAKYFLFLARQNEDDSISNMKLQKLLYYAQGFHLAIFEKVLFSEQLEKWIHGPVVPSVYRVYKKYGNKPIPYQDDLDLDLFSPEIRELLDEVYEVYGQFSAFALRNLSHEEPPWKSASDGGVINTTAMKNYFKTRLVNGEEET